MARHSKIYNSLYSFYTNDIDGHVKDMIEAYDKLPSENDDYENLKGVIQSNLEAILDLARDQANHVGLDGLMKEWEVEYLVNDVAVYCDKQIKKLKKRKILGPSASAFTALDFMSNDDKMFEVDLILAKIRSA